MGSNSDTNRYFPHDSNARNSDKLIRLRMVHKAAGYGVYFMILERLREEPNYMSVKDYNMIAFDLRVDASLVKTVVEDFGLFVFTEDGEYFYSESFTRRMEYKDEKTRKRADAGKKGMVSRWGKNNNVITKTEETDNNVITMLSETDNNKKKRKEKEENNPPYNPPRGSSGDNFVLSKILSDGTERNYPGIIECLEKLNLPQNQVDEILYQSNYGEIGHPVWALLRKCLDSAEKSSRDPSKIRLPGNFIIQELKKAGP